MRWLKDFARIIPIWIVVWLVVRIVFPSGFIAQYLGDEYIFFFQDFYAPATLEPDKYLLTMTEKIQLLLVVNVLLFVFWYTTPLWLRVNSVAVPRRAKNIWVVLLGCSVVATAVLRYLSPEQASGFGPWVVLAIMALLSLFSFYLASCLASPPAFKYLVPGAASMWRR